ncbi:MAG: phosphoribosyltransferase [Candidatus Aenigmarchaeota archaeon]|nr:phosphoribosyltransferase [Candidatus Aenigmarchaeota archaeon]
MTWEQFGSLVAALAEMVKKDYRPDVVVGLTRGGWAPSRVLCDHLGIKNLGSLKVEHWGVTATPDGSAKIKSSLNADVKGRKVLVVDDLTDTGESMDLAVDYVKSREPAEVRTAVLMNIRGSKFTPDYYVKEIGWKWVIFPWNFFEDMKNIIPKVLDGDNSASKIKTKLKENFKIDVDEEVLAKVISEVKPA